MLGETLRHPTVAQCGDRSLPQALVLLTQRIGQDSCTAPLQAPLHLIPEHWVVLDTNPVLLPEKRQRLGFLSHPHYRGLSLR